MSALPDSSSPAQPRRGQIAAPSILAGALLALAVPPWGFWPLAVVGLAILYRLSAELGTKHRFVAGVETGFVLYAATLWWMTEFHPAALLVPLIEAAFLGLALVLTPPGLVRGRPLCFAAAVLLADAARSRFPVRGLPLGGLDLGLVSSPLAHTARLGGRLLLPALAALAAAGLVELLGRRWARGAVALALVGAALAAAAVVPHGRDVKAIDVALVQGGGRRGYRAVDGDPARVFEAHLAATEGVQPPVDLVMWPEDVIDVEGPIATAAEGAEMSSLARSLGATVVAGVVEGETDRFFRNVAVAWGPDGQIVARFEKVRRVPFGEYIPMRRLVDKVADLAVIPRDAKVGRGSGLLRTPAGPLATAISYEVFFPDRVRSGVGAGGQLVLIPTNAASFAESLVPTQQLGAARLRAIESGRWLLQAGPTGYSAVISPDGVLVDRTVLGRQQVLHASVALRSGLTPYGRTGDAPVLALSGLALVVTRRVRLSMKRR